ncbi:hypothetical protein GCM10009687_21430 [Asanoa iriomotensis]|uniref:Uncharacterized protein n=1 Tax=Asanoa iriomotensis TaxID=234613 RepID=A0ABQ4CA40_9ACTN|nr:hypothetical protein Air01nite_57410 [Asanoa iriomotensis]
MEGCFAWSRKGHTYTSTPVAVALRLVMVDWLSNPLTPVMAAFAYPCYLLLMAAVLRIIGVRRQDIAAWALKQADRRRLLDFVRVARRQRPSIPPTDVGAQDPKR